MKMRHFRIITSIILISLTFSSCDQALDLLSNDQREPFIGSYSVTENNTLKSVDNYEASIVKSSTDTTAILIKNFYAISYNVSVEGIVSGDNVTIPNQTVSGFTIQGYGLLSVNGKTIDWSYTVDHNNGFTDAVTATYTKQ
jgi:hypothetical protein